jgi:type I restriction enzyme M protein
MYFTHSNLVYFMLDVLDLDGLTVETWTKSTHPENRLPYVIDPACGSGAFLLRAMHIITNAVRSRKPELVSDADAEQFFSARMSDSMPNYWAEAFIYGLDPKFIMAITAKINMVLHGDGSAHIFKEDALKPLSALGDGRFNPVGDPLRTVSKSAYPFDVCETFNVIVSNPPFGITLSSDTRVTLPSSFATRSSAPSESYFLERWYQLLKPGGRLGVVVPESLFNSADNMDSRLFLYRMFWIRAIVSLPRSLFIETPTLTSLLFAQKKTESEVASWDDQWRQASTAVDDEVAKNAVFLKAVRKAQNFSLSDVRANVLPVLTEVIPPGLRIRRGRERLSAELPGDVVDVEEACDYYLRVSSSAHFRQLSRVAAFRRACEAFDYEYPVYVVDEVGYKLSKRKERLRPNQLCRFVGSESGGEIPNLHLAREPVELVVDPSTPQRVLDFVRRDVEWA